MEYFISDLHFNHSRIATMRNFPSYQEMNEALISTYNSVVKENDTVYFLGDFCFREDPKLFLDRPNGHLYFIKGNHDKQKIVHKKILHWVDGYYDIKLHEYYMTLCHFPMLAWEKSHYGAWMLHGHHHNATTGIGKILNVSVDNLNMKPLSFDELVVIMKNKPENPDLIRKEINIKESQ